MPPVKIFNPENRNARSNLNSRPETNPQIRSGLTHQQSMNEKHMKEKLSPSALPKTYFEQSHTDDIDMDNSINKYIDLNSTLTPYTQERDQSSNDNRAAAAPAVVHHPNPDQVLARSKLSPSQHTPQNRYISKNSNTSEFQKKKQS